MDFEEQLEKAEKLTSPSLVGSSMRSADDSAHQNYIHPEKYTGKKSKPGKLSILNSSIGASLDDLISEGALLGSEEDFEKFLDDTGNVKSNAKYLAKDSNSKKLAAIESVSSPLRTQFTAESDLDASSVISPVESAQSAADPAVSDNAESGATEGTSLYETDNFSAPNLSEYQLDHQIADHSQLLDSVKSYDLKKLPSSHDRERSKTNELYAASERVPKGAKATAGKKVPTFATPKPDDPRIVDSDSLHTPYFQRDDRSPSRSRAAQLNVGARSRSTSRSRSVTKPHLARGDSYKSTHEDSPAKYELPADLAVEEEDEGNDRRSRQSRPTMGDSIAAAEAKERADFHSENITRDPSLVTTGDYTNFNADAPGKRFEDLNLYSVRSQSSTNYLRSISRSRSRQPAGNIRRDHTLLNEKNDADPEELAKEGALVSDDPYDQMTGLDAMVDKVLKKPHDSEESKNLVNDVSAEKKVTETKEQLIAESAPTVTAKDINVGEEKEESEEKEEEKEDVGVGEEKAQVEDEKVKEIQEDSLDESVPEVDVPAEVKEQEAKKQLMDEKAPLVSAKDIKVGGTEEDEVEEAETKASGSEPKETEESDNKEDELPTEASETAARTAEISAEVSETVPDVEEAEKKTLITEPDKLVMDEEVEKPESENSHEESTEESVLDNEEKTEGFKGEDEQELGEETVNETKETNETEFFEKLDKYEEAELASESKDVSFAEPEENEEPSTVPTLVSTGTGSVTADKEIDGAEADVEVPEVEKPTEAPTEPATDLPTLVSTGTGSVTADKETSEEKEEESESEEKDVTDEIEAETKDFEPEVKEVESEAKSEAVPEAEKGESETPKETGPEAEPEAEEDEDFDVSPAELRKHLEGLPVYLFTSLAGGMKIIQRTNRLATILQGNGVKFEYRDLGTDEEAKKIWRRYAQGKMLPGVVRGDDFIGNLEYIEEVNEDYRLQEVLYETL